MWRAIVVPRKAQDQISDDMRWIEFLPFELHISIMSRSNGSRCYTSAIPALLPWNRNRRPIKTKNKA